MSMTTPRYWLEARSGDSSPDNRGSGGASTMTGSPTLTNLGTEYAWRFSAVTGSAGFTALPTSVPWESPTVAPITYAIRLAVNTNPSAAYQRMAGFSATNAAMDSANGACAGKSGSMATIQVQAGDGTDITAIGALFTVSTTPKTLIVRINPGTSGLPDTIRVWKEGGSGSTPDYTSTGATYSGTAHALAYAIVQAGDGAVDVCSLALWAEGLSDADCRTLATDIRTAMAPPSGPTITVQPTAQTANEGATASFSVTATGTGTLHYAWERQPPGGGAYAAVGSDATPYTTGALDCATDHLANFRVTVTDNNGPTVSNVVSLTVRSVTTISRPGADVTDNGWTASSGVDLFAMIDETTASTADYIESPALSASPVWTTIAMQYPLETGARIVDIELAVTSGTGTVKVRFVNDAGAVMGSAADQAVTTTPTIYSLPVTLTGPATRVEISAVL